MFSISYTKNRFDSDIIVVRIDLINSAAYRSRWNRTAHGWEAMRYKVQVHSEQLSATFGEDLFRILDWAVENETPGNWSEHLKNVQAGTQVRVDLDSSNKAIKIAPLIATIPERVHSLAESAKVVELFPDKGWLNLSNDFSNDVVENPEGGE